MPRYFFDADDGRLYREDAGQNLADDRAAWLEALRFTRALEQVLAPGEGWRVEVRKDDMTIFRLEIRTECLHAKCGSRT